MQLVTLLWCVLVLCVPSYSTSCPITAGNRHQPFLDPSSISRIDNEWMDVYILMLWITELFSVSFHPWFLIMLGLIRGGSPKWTMGKAHPSIHRFLLILDQVTKWNPDIVPSDSLYLNLTNTTAFPSQTGCSPSSRFSYRVSLPVRHTRKISKKGNKGKWWSDVQTT